MITQTMVSNVLCVLGFTGVALLQHFGYIDSTNAVFLYTAIGIMGGYKNGTVNNTNASSTLSTNTSDVNAGISPSPTGVSNVKEEKITPIMTAAEVIDSVNG